MKDIALKNITILLLLVYLVMQLLCIAPITRISQIVFVVWFLFAYAAYTPIVRKTLSSKVVGTLVVFLLYYGLSLLFSHDVLYSISAVLSMLEMFSPLLMYHILKDDTKKTKTIVFICVSFIFVFNIISCYSYINHSVMSSGLRDIELFTNYKNTFFVLYSIVLLVPFVIYYLSQLNFKSKRFLGIRLSIIAYVICAFLAYFVIKAQFMTAIVVMVSGVLFAFFHKRKGSIIVIPVAALLFVFLFVAFSDTLIQITDENDMTAVSQRLEEIQHITARNAEEAQDFSYRQDLTRTSFETFLEHPLFGVHYKYESINEAKLLSIGNHAEWVDSLAKYGLFGILLIYFIIKVILKQKRLIDTNIHYLLFIVLGFFNPIFSFYMVFTVFAYLPLLRYVCFEE